MAHNLHLADVAANAQADALAALANNGFMRIYTGPQPADANTAITTQTLLAELTLGSPAFAPAVAGVLTANPITEEDDAPATGDAAWYRIFEADGTTVLWDGSAGTADADPNLVMPTVSIQQHAHVGVSSFTHRVNE